jgi:hypothetical protein
VVDHHQSNPSEPGLQDLAGAQTAETAAPTDPFQGISSNRLEAAFQYVERGLAIFPCEPGDKRPETPHGFKDASRALRPYDHPRLKGFAQFFQPDGTELLVNAQENWAIEPGPHGFTILDLDPKNGSDKTWAELVARHGSVTTREVRTPKGGRHLWLRGTLPTVNRKLGPGIDTRCFGGYVLLPPSSVVFELNGLERIGHYSWVDDTVPIAPLPAWITEEIDAAAAREAELHSELRDQAKRDRAARQLAAAPIDGQPDPRVAYDGQEGNAFERRLALIGDHEGGEGFYDPMLRAVGAGVALGMAADAILDRLREAAETADRRNHSLTEIRDRLSKMPGAIQKFQANDAQRRCEAEELDLEKPSEPDQEDDDEEEIADAQQAEETADATEQPSQDNEASSQTSCASHEEAVALAKSRLQQALCDILDSPDPDKRLIKGTMGLGKTWTLLKLLAERTDPTNPAPVLRFEREEHKEYRLDALLKEDLGSLDELSPVIGQVVYAGQRHDLLEAAAEKLRTELSTCGWHEEDIEENVVILSGRDRDASTCLRPEEAKLISAAGGSVSDNLCLKPATSTKPAVICPFYEECQWQKTKRRAARARFVFMTHAHLSTPFGPPGLPDRFHPQNADLIIIDEDPTSTLIDEKPTSVAAGAFREHLPDEHHGGLIEEALARSDTLDFLRDKDVTADKLLEVAEYRKRRERRRRIGHPRMNLAERQAELERQQSRTSVPKLSRCLECLAAEVKSERRGECYSIRHDPKIGGFLARARKATWNMSRQKVVVLDGTANVEELGLFIPRIKEVQIEVPRNAIIIQVCDATYSKQTTVTGSKKTGFTPSPLLTRTWEFIQRFAQVTPPEEQGKPQIGAITTKTIRHALQEPGSPPKPEDKFEVATAFRGTLLGHYRNVRGSNDFEDCLVGFLIGRDELPVQAIEDETRALHFDTPTPTKFVKPGPDGKKRLVSIKARYEMKDGTIHERSDGATIHPDWRCQLRNAATREKEMSQALDRLRLIPPISSAPVRSLPAARLHDALDRVLRNPTAAAS